MTEDNEAWIPAWEAVQLLKPVTGGEYSAQRTICEHANDDLIKSRAERFVEGKNVKDDVELTKHFWRLRGGTGFTQRWNTGHFEYWKDRDTLCRAYGVRFLRSGIMKIVDQSGVQAQQSSAVRGSKIFIGHGHSLVWRELKDFIVEQLKLPYDEFNAQSPAGVTNVARLEKMLDDAAFAFLVLTAENRLDNGAMQARMNVIHEAGLFQARLGFEKAILLLEDGCDEFSNIHGLGHIPFPPGKIEFIFERVRGVLQREGVIQGRP